jgi:hypothetical protein
MLASQDTPEPRQVPRPTTVHRRPLTQCVSRAGSRRKRLDNALCGEPSCANRDPRDVRLQQPVASPYCANWGSAQQTAGETLKRCGTLHRVFREHRLEWGSGPGRERRAVVLGGESVLSGPRRGRAGRPGDLSDAAAKRVLHSHLPVGFRLLQRARGMRHRVQAGLRAVRVDGAELRDLLPRRAATSRRSWRPDGGGAPGSTASGDCPGPAPRSPS